MSKDSDLQLFSLETDNVTIRKLTRSQSQMNLTPSTSQDLMNSTMLDSTMLSTHSDTQNYDQSYSVDLRREINEIKGKLNSADSEIENLNCENTKLKQVIQEQRRHIELLKKITCGTPQRKNNSTPISRRILSMTVNTPRHSPLRLAKSSCIISPSACTSQQDKPECNTDIQSESRCCYVENQMCKKSHRPISVEGPPIPTQSNKHKVIILGDGQGRGLRNILQNLLGSEYIVFSYLKPGAVLSEILECSKNEISTLTRSDYVIILGGCCDKNPYDIDINLHRWLSSTANTNVIISEVPNNRFLKESKINYLLRFICKKYKNVLFMDMNYARFPPSRRNYVLNLARSLLKEILCIHYHFKASQYEQLCQIKSIKTFESKYVQVNLDPDQNLIDNRIKTDCINETSNEHGESECNIENPNLNNLFRL